MGLNVLEMMRKRLVKGTVIVFDEFFGYPNWQNHEYKAFKEELRDVPFKFVAFSRFQAAIEIMGKGGL